MEKLIFVDDSLPGIRRERAASGWRYRDAAGKVIRDRALRGEAAGKRRWNTPLLDVEGIAIAPVEASTPCAGKGLNVPLHASEIHLSSGGGRC